MRKFSLLFLCSLVFVMPVLAGAQTTGSSANTTTGAPLTGSSAGKTIGNQTPTGPTITLVNPLGPETTLWKLLESILKLVVRLGTIVIIFMIIFIGYKFVAARGNPSEIAAARGMLLWTIVGGLILLGAEAIANAIHATALSLSTGK